MSQRRGSRRRRRIRFNPEVIAARVIVGAAVIGGLMVGGHSTGWSVTNRLFAGLFAGLVALATSRARRWTWLVVSGGATLVALSADDNFASAMAVWALALAIGSVATDKRDRAIGALIGALSIQALLRIRGFGDSGVSALLTLAIAAPVLLSAYRRIPSEPHRRLRRGVLIACGVAAFLMLPVAIGALLARGRIESGIEDVRAGFAAAEQGNKADATARFRKAASEFDSAKTFVDSWWAKPARIVPFGGIQTEAISVATSEGNQLAVAASRLADVEQEALSVEDGTVAIDAISRLAGPLADADATLEHAAGQLDHVSSTFLLPPLSSRLDKFEQQVADALPAARDAQAVVRLAPAMLGNEAPRRYLVLFTTPAEARGTGGFVGSWALLTADHGHIALTSTGRINQLNDIGHPPRTLTGPERYLSTYTADFHPEIFFQNVTASPDFPDVASVVTQLVPQTELKVPIDGVVLLDPIAMASMLRFTGPVKVPGLPGELNAQNAAKVFLYDQYSMFRDRREDPEAQPGTREDFLADALKVTFESFLSQQLPRPQNMVSVLGPVVEQRRLMAFSVNPDEEALFKELGMDGSFPTADTGDFLSLVTTNRGGNKLDAYLHRELTYDVDYSPSSGNVQTTATVVLRNEAPPDGLPFEVGYNNDDLPVGTNQTALTLYSPLDLSGLTSDGQPIGFVRNSEFGFSTYTVYLDLPPQSQATLVFTLQGSAAPSANYRLRIAPQPLAIPDKVDVHVTASGGWQPRKQPRVTVHDDAAQIAVDPSVATDTTVAFR